MTDQIKERVRKIIDTEQLTNSKFAEMIDVPRSSISHLFNDRNKPSLEFVTKILTTFTTLNSEWLLFGRGPMHKGEAITQKLFEQPEPIKEREVNVHNEVPENFDNEQEKKYIKEEKEILQPENIEPKEKIETKVPEKEEQIEYNNENNSSQKEQSPTENNSKKINPNTERIIIFSSDRTFIEYMPK